jgi:hypothetical protein
MKISPYTIYLKMQPNALLIRQNFIIYKKWVLQIITYLDTSYILALPAKEELLQLTALGIGSKNKIEDPTPFPFSIKEDCFDDDIGNSSKAPACDLKGSQIQAY